MTTKQLRFDNHAAFHGQVLRVTIAGAAIAFAGYLLNAIFGVSSDGTGVFGVLQLTLTAAALGLAANPPQGREWVGVGLFGVAVALLTTLSMRALSGSPPAYPWFGVCVYGLAVGVIAGRDLKDRRRYFIPLATGLSMLLAIWARGVFVAKVPLTEYVPAFLSETLYGAAFGFLVSIGLVARQIRFERDRVMQAFEQIKGSLSGEILELCERGMATYKRIAEALRERERHGETNDPKLIKGVQNLMAKIVSLGKRWQEVEREASRTSADSLTDRVSELDNKIAEAKDAVARRQYEMARDALQAQLGYLRDISRSRERVTARVHNYLAALERLHLAVLNHQSADAAKFSDELQPILDEIDDIGIEMDIASEALAEAAEVTLKPASADDQAEEAADQSQSQSQSEEAGRSEEAEEAEEAEAAEEVESQDEAESKEPAEDPETALQRRAFEE